MANKNTGFAIFHWYNDAKSTILRFGDFRRTARNYSGRYLDKHCCKYYSNLTY